MKTFAWIVPAALVGVVLAGAACAQDAEDTTTTVTPTEEAGAMLDEVKRDGGNALDAISAGADKALDATREGAAAVLDEARDAEKTAGATKDVLAAAGRDTSDALSSTGEAITDGWIATKVRAKFVDEALLKASDIDVDIDDGVVTLAGIVRSEAAKLRAAGITRTTEGVTRVVNHLVVTSN